LSAARRAPPRLTQGHAGEEAPPPPEELER